jgi:SAM-dependent methyltransferase
VTSSEGGTADLPFRDATFDAVTAGFVVSHFPDFRAGLEELRRVCRVGGQIAMSAWGSLPNAASRLWSDIAATLVPPGELDQAFRAHVPWDEHFSHGMNVGRAFEDAGLVSVTSETRDYEIRMATADFLLTREASIQGMSGRSRVVDRSGGSVATDITPSKRTVLEKARPWPFSSHAVLFPERSAAPRLSLPRSDLRSTATPRRALCEHQSWTTR